MSYSRPTKDGADAPVLRLHAPAQHPPCEIGQLRRSIRPPGVHWLGPDPQHPGYEIYEIVSDEGYVLQSGPIARVLLRKLLPFFDWWRGKTGEVLHEEQERCPDCPARPAPLERRGGRRRIARLA